MRVGIADYRVVNPLRPKLRVIDCRASNRHVAATVVDKLVDVENLSAADFVPNHFRRLVVIGHTHNLLLPIRVAVDGKPAELADNLAFRLNLCDVLSGAEREGFGNVFHNLVHAAVVLRNVRFQVV